MINKHKHAVPVILFAVLATVLVFSWFRGGHLYGGGDVGIPSYDPQRILDIARYVWWDVSAPGTTVPQGLTSVPFQFAQAIAHNAGLSYVLTQALFFWVIIFFMGYGMFLMALTVFGKEKTGLAFLAGLFYELNPYMMIDVWHRFIHTTFFLAAALPFIFIFWSRWIKGGRYFFLFLFLLTSFLSSYLFGTLAFIVVILVILTWIVLCEVLFPWTGLKYLKIISFRFILGLFIWFLIQSWWMVPSFGIAPAVLYAQHSVGGNLTTLLSISEQTIIPYSLFGLNPFYIYDQLDFGSIYNSPAFRILPFLTLIFLIPGFIKSLTVREWSGWSLLFIIGLFLAKGAAAPFGHTYLFAFTNFFPLGVLRNPFEKLGILIPFSGAILFSLGINYCLKQRGLDLKRLRWGRSAAVVIILVLLFGVFQWPVWSGKLFGKLENPPYVEVPKTYSEADKYLKDQASEGNILHLPLTTGESATYFWDYGYNGVESSQLYFNSLPSISRGFNIGYVDDALSALSIIFSVKEAEDDKIIDLLKAFNVRFVVLHKDMEWRGGNLSDPVVLEKTLNTKVFLNRKASFGNLIVYQFKDQYFAAKLRFAKNPQFISPGKENSYWPWLIKQGSGDFLSAVDKQQDNNLPHFGTGFIVVPKNIYSYAGISISGKEAADELPPIRILPGSLLYPLISLKEEILLFSMNEADKVNYRLTLAGKRLAEIYKIKEQKINAGILPLLESYQDLLPDLKNEINARKGEGLVGGGIPFESVFARHIAVLDLLITDMDGFEKTKADETRNQVKNLLKLTGLSPNVEIKENENLPKANRLISSFQIPEDADYEILQAVQNGQYFYPGNLLTANFQIDDSIKSLSGVVKGPFISYGFIHFTKGLHEISFYPVLSNNFIKPGEFEITSATHQPGTLDFEIDPVTGGGWYQLAFESWIKLGDAFKVQLIQDSDPQDPAGEEGTYMSFNKEFGRGDYNNFWNKSVFNLNIRPATTKAKIRFLVQPWDDCKTVFAKEILCKNPQIKYNFEHPGLVSFRNVEIKRTLRNPVFVAAKLPKKEATGSGSVEFIQSSPVSYSGKLDAKTPQYLIFAETFHPGWQLKLNDYKKQYSLAPQYIANLYSSAWYIDQAGEYFFTLEFAPQRLVTKGVIISLLGWSGIVILVFWQRLKR